MSVKRDSAKSLYTLLTHLLNLVQRSQDSSQLGHIEVVDVDVGVQAHDPHSGLLLVEGAKVGVEDLLSDALSDVRGALQVQLVQVELGEVALPQLAVLRHGFDGQHHWVHEVLL